MSKTEKSEASPLAVYLRECHAEIGSPSVREIASHIGTSHSAVHMVLTGQRIPRPYTLTALATYLRADLVKARSLVGESRPGPPTSLARRTALMVMCEEVTALREDLTEGLAQLREAISDLSRAIRRGP